MSLSLMQLGPVMFGGVDGIIDKTAYLLTVLIAE